MTDKSIEMAIHKLANIVITKCSSSVGSDLGKLGSVIFLLHYAKYCNMDKYKSYAIELLEYIQDNSIISNNSKVNIHNLISICIGINYIISQELVLGDLDDILEDVDNFILSYLDNKNIMYLKYQNLIVVGKYFLLRIGATPLSANHVLHITALERIVGLLKLHIINIPIYNPLIIKFLYYSSKVLSNKSIEMMLIQQLNNYPNQTNWYRSGIPHCFNTFFIPKDDERLKKIIIKEIKDYVQMHSKIDYSDILIEGNAGLIVWMNLLSDDLSTEKCSAIKNAAVEKIVSNMNNYKVPIDVSLYFGCSGIGLALLSCIDNKCTQWIKLL